MLQPDVFGINAIGSGAKVQRQFSTTVHFGTLKVDTELDFHSHTVI